MRTNYHASLVFYANGYSPVTTPTFFVGVSVDGGDPVSVGIPNNTSVGKRMARLLQIALDYLADGDHVMYSRALLRLEGLEDMFWFDDEISRAVVPLPVGWADFEAAA